MANNAVDRDLQHIWKSLTKEYNAQQTTEEKVPFNNQHLSRKLSRLRNNARFAPLIARDLQSSKSFAPSSSINTWEIVFSEQWQDHDRCNTFNNWCDKTHKAAHYEDMMAQFEVYLNNWADKLALDEQHSSAFSDGWFRPPTFASTLKMSLEMELTSDWSTFYKDNLEQMKQAKYSINFSINQLYSTQHCNLIDAIYFAKCVNWNAAYDPKHSAKTNIPIYWIFAEIKFDFPTSKEVNGSTKMYSPNTFRVPISCYGLMNVEVNAIKDWYKLSPHCPECRDVRGRLQINDDVEVFVFDKWENGKIIDCVIMNHNEVNTEQRNEPIVEYLQVQTTTDAIVRYNRYDDRLRPCLNTKNIEYDSKILFNRPDDSKYEEEHNDKLLTPPAHINIEQNAPPCYDIGGVEQTEQTLDEYKVGPNDPTPDLHENINEDLLNSFDFRNKEIMEKYQNDLRETMETMKQLALRRTVVTDIFRPVHLVCPKLSYRLSVTDENEVNLTVLSRNDDYDYIALKMIDTEDTELSEMTVYMTKKQLFEHCTTYFHFSDMNGAANDMDFEYEYNRKQQEKKKKEIIHKVPPKIALVNEEQNHSMDQSLDIIHQYMRDKDSSTSPKRRTVFSSEESREDSKEDPRSHLQDEELCSFLHDEQADDDNSNESKNETQNSSFIISAHSQQQQLFIDNNWSRKETPSEFTMLMDKTQEPIGSASQHLINTTDDMRATQLTIENHNEEPGTPKMIFGSPVMDDEPRANITASNNEKQEDCRSDTSDFDPVIPERVTQGMDLAESGDDNDEHQEYIMKNETKARSSVTRVGTAPNEGKYEEQETQNVEFKFDNFNDIGVNAYDERDDEINELNDLNAEYNVKDVPIERIYTVNPCFGNGCVILFVIMLSIILVPILSGYVPDKYRYFDFDLLTTQMKPYWDDLMRQIEQMWAHFGFN